MYQNVHNGLIHNSQKLEIVQVPITKQMAKLVVYSDDGILFGSKKKNA